MDIDPACPPIANRLADRYRARGVTIKSIAVIFLYYACMGEEKRYAKKAQWGLGDPHHWHLLMPWHIWSAVMI